MTLNDEDLDVKRKTVEAAADDSLPFEIPTKIPYRGTEEQNQRNGGIDVLRNRTSSRANVLLSEFLKDALSRVDGSDEQWPPPMWVFTRTIRAHPELIELSCEEAVQRITEHVPLTDGEQTAVLVAWDRIRLPGGADPLQTAFQISEQKQLVPARCKGGRFGLYAKLVSIAGWLQVLMGPTNMIFIPTRKAAALLDCDKNTISGMLRLAEEDGYVELKQPGNEYRSPRFVFDLDCFPELRDWRQ